METSFKGWEGFYVTAEDDVSGVVTHGPRPGVDGPPSVGPWETWTAEPQEDGSVAFKSWRGRYLSAQPDGRVLANRTWVRPWEQFTPVAHPDGGVAWKTAHGTYLRGVAQAARPATQSPGIDHQATEPQQWENWITAGFGASGPQPGAHPLRGQVRVVGRSFADESGPRRVLGCSWFPAIRVLRDNPTRYHAQLDAIRNEGYLVNRRFRCVGGRDGGTDPRSIYWRGSGVHPRDWSDYDQLYVMDLQQHAARGLTVHCTAGDMGQTFPDGHGELEYTVRVARLIRDHGLEPVVALFEIWNEGWQNNAHGDDPRRGVELATAVRGILPNVLIGLSTPASGEEPSGMLAWSPLQRAVNLLPMHGMREWERCLERAFTLSYWDWEYPGGRPNAKRPIWQGEPVGDGDDVYMDITRQTPHWRDILFGLHWVFQMCGQAGIYFNGPAVLYKEPRTLQDEWGFTHIAKLMAPIPEDVGQWPHISHGNKRGTTPLDARVWSTDGRPGVGRVDQVWNDRALVAVVHGGPGPWRPYATRGLRGTAYGSAGPLFSFEAGPGQDLPGEWRADQHVVGVVAEFS